MQSFIEIGQTIIELSSFENSRFTQYQVLNYSRMNDLYQWGRISDIFEYFLHNLNSNLVAEWIIKLKEKKSCNLVDWVSCY